MKSGMKPFVLLTVGIALLAGASFQAPAQGGAFTYQGVLSQNGAGFTGSAEFQPSLWNTNSGGNQVAINNPSSIIVSVTNGLFTVALDFGEAPFNSGADRWLQLQVRTAIGPFTTLSPRQKLTPT